MTNLESAGAQPSKYDGVGHAIVGSALCAAGVAYDLEFHAGTPIAGTLIITGLAGLVAGFLFCESTDSFRRVVRRAIACVLILAVIGLFEFFVHAAIAEPFGPLVGLSLPWRIAGGAGFAIAVLVGFSLPALSLWSHLSGSSSGSRH